MAESFNSRIPTTTVPGLETVPPSFGGGAQAPVVFPDIGQREDAGGAKQIDLEAREKLGGFKSEWDQFELAHEQPAAPNEFDAFPVADDLDVKSVDELDKDRAGFDPVSSFSENPDVANDPAKLKKLLDVYRKRREEGLTAGGVASAAVTGTPGLVADIAGGVKRLGESVIDVAIQPTANVVLGSLSGDLFDKQKREALFAETKRIQKKAVAEVSAGSEAATVGIVDLTRQGLRKLENKPGQVPDDLPQTRVGRVTPPDKPKTDSELLAELSDDASFREQAKEIIEGQGEAAKTIGLDAETLAREGITLDPNAIEALSLVDPVSIFATGGAFKLVGLGGKVIGSARTLSGAEKLSEGLGKLAKFSSSKLAKGVGRVATDAGKAVESRTFGAFGLGSPLITGDISTLAGVAGAKYVVGPVAKKTGATLTQVGKEIAGDLPASAGLTRLMKVAGGATDAGVSLGEGAVKGALASAPFALAADDDETSGSLLGAGVALGTGADAAGKSFRAGAGAFRAVKTNAARELFGPNRKPMPDVESPDYGRAPDLDALNKTEVAKLTPQNRADLNNFREALRSQGGEIYAVNKETFRSKVADEYKTRTGKELDPAMLDTYERHSAFFDETVAGKKVVYLNSDTTGLLHDSGHIFDALLSPEKQAELNTAIDNTFTPEAIAEFQKNYEGRVGNKISADDAKKEYRAELFGALFNSVPVTDLAAPKSLLKKFAGIAAEGAEALGIDLTGGAKTPSLGAGQTVGLRSMFEYAARDVLKKGQEVPPRSSEPPPPATAPTQTPPTAPAPVRAPTGSRPILPSGTDLPPPVTPEARAAAAKRFSETGIEQARLNAASDPAVAKGVEDVSAHMETGNPVLEIDHLGIASEGTPATPEGRTSRRATQAAGYEALKGELSRAGAPADLVQSHLKTFVPVRWTNQGGTPTLVAASLDKALQNIRKVGSDPKAASLIPYPTENGNLTAQGWREAVSDLKAYAENQANGRRGDGGRLTVPEAGELSIPSENPNYTPQPLSPERADFQNLVMGLKTPDTSRKAPKGKTPGNVKGQILADANLRKTETPANISAARASKQAYADFSPRTVQEVNPLRNRLKEAGAPSVGELIEVTEMIRAIDIEKVTPRPDISFKAPVTDIIRGGFLPAPTEFRQKNLAGKTVSEFSEYILNSSPDEWKTATDNFTGGLTGGAWNLGLSLKDAADVAVLKSFQDKLSTATKEAMTSGDFDKAYSLVSRGQFFREAYEAATGTGSAGAAFKRGTMGTEGVKVPFPAETPTK